jgi:hypothetical protein
MPTTKPILAFTLLLSVGAFAAECDEAHKYQHCQLPVLKKIAGLVTTVGYTEGVCYPIVIDDEGGSSSGEPEVVVSKLSDVAAQS